MKEGCSFPEKRRFWSFHVESWLGSGKSRRAYAVEKGLIPRTFSRWCQKRVSQSSPDGISVASVSDIQTIPSQGQETRTGGEVGLPPLVPVSPEVVSALLGRKAPKRPAGVLTLRVGKCYQVKVPEGFSPSHLVAVLRTLEKIR